jgi:hypothetical protein
MSDEPTNGRRLADTVASSAGTHPVGHSAHTRLPHCLRRPDCRPNEATVSKPSKTPANKAPHDAALAWELGAAARPHLSTVEADHIYIANGIGETFEAIDALITAIARERIPVGEALAATVSAWLDCYLGQNAEPLLRQLIAEVKTYPPQRTGKAAKLPRSSGDARITPTGT